MNTLFEILPLLIPPSADRYCSCSSGSKTHFTAPTLSLWKQIHMACDRCCLVALWADYLFCLWKGGE